MESAVGQGTAFLFTIKASLPNGNTADPGEVLLNSDANTPNTKTSLAIQSADERAKYHQLSEGTSVKTKLEDCQVKFQGIVFKIDEPRVHVEIN